MICAFYKLLNNPLKVDLLVRVHKAREGVNIALLADMMTNSGLGLSGVSQYLKQLQSFNAIRRERTGQYVNYVAKTQGADEKVKEAIGIVVANERKREKFGPIFAAMMNPFRAKVVAMVAEAGSMSGEDICEKTGHQSKHLKRDLKEAIEIGLLVADDSDAKIATYRYNPPQDPILVRLVEVCF